MFKRNKAMCWSRDEKIIDSIWQASGFTHWVQHFREFPWVKRLVHRVRQAAVQVWGPLMWFGSIPRAGWPGNPGNNAWMSRPRHGELVERYAHPLTLHKGRVSKYASIKSRQPHPVAKRMPHPVAKRRL